MKTITAEFEWSNFLIIILGIILGINRSWKKKKQDLPSNEEVSSTETDKQLVEEVIVPENHFSSFQEEDYKTAHTVLASSSIHDRQLNALHQVHP